MHGSFTRKWVVLGFNCPGQCPQPACRCAPAHRGCFSLAISFPLPRPLCVVDRMSVPPMGTLKLSEPGELGREAGTPSGWVGESGLLLGGGGT